MKFRKSSYSMNHGSCVECGSGFRKSSISLSNGNCAEIGEFRKSSLSEATNCAEIGEFRKSAHSNPNGACTEVAIGTTILVRDTMNRQGFTLEVTSGAWREFIARVKKAESAFSKISFAPGGRVD